MNKLAKALLVTLAVVAPLSLGALNAQAKTMPHHANAKAKVTTVALAPATGAKVTKVHHSKHHAKHQARAHKHNAAKHLARK